MNSRAPIVALATSLAACARPAAQTSSVVRTSLGSDASEAASQVEDRCHGNDPDGGCDGYDLSLELRTRVDLARTMFGDQVRTQIVGDTFVLVATSDTVPLEAAVSLATRAVTALDNGRFTRRPDRAVGVLLFARASAYAAYCKRVLGIACDDDLGTYAIRRSEILVDVSSGITTLTHEMVHAYVEHDFPLAPRWLNEGMASLFEKPVFPSPGEIHGLPNWRMHALVNALNGPDAPSRPRIEDLFGMSDDAFSSRGRMLHYAMARALCEWLDERNELWAFYHAWQREGRDDPSGVLAFRFVEHRTPREAQDEWVRWVRVTSGSIAR